MKKEDISPLTARDELEIFDDLTALSGSNGYIHAVAYFCWRDNLIGFSDGKINADDLQHQYSHDRLVRTEISTLIGLMAKGKIDLSIPPPEILQSYVDRSEALLHEMHMSLQKPWMEAFKVLAQNPKSGVDPFGTAQGLREPIFYGGESAYNFQYGELSKLKYKADTDWFSAHRGFTVDEANLLANAIGTLQMQKLVDYRSEMKLLPPDKWTFLPGFVFTAAELAPRTGLDLEKIERFLDAFSFNREARNPSFSSLSAYNETNAAPIIKVSDGSYILLQQYSLLEALYEAPFFWMAGDNAYRATAAKNRGKFAEEFLAERLVAVFGARNVVANVDIYKGKDRICEIDILVLYGDIFLVVQAKSKRLTIESRKGNDLQLKDDFKKAIQDAYDQALLCSKALAGEGYRFVLPSGDEFDAPKNPSTIFPLCIVADHYPALAVQARQFLRIEKTEVIQSPIVSDVFFMDVLTEILSSPLHFINYLALRARFDKKLLVSQELTNLGYHLGHNLWLEDKYDMVNLGDDFASSLDVAMSARRQGLPGEKVPKGILTRHNGSPIGTLLLEIEANETPELVGLGLILLQLSADSAKHINSGIVQLVGLAAQDGKPHDFSVPSSADKSGFTIHVNSLGDDEAQKRLSAHCQIKKYDTKSDTWYGILLAPGTGNIRGALSARGKWQMETGMEEALKLWPRKDPTPIGALSLKTRRAKIGRNEPCPCGSGRKYKKCCLSN